MPKREEPLLILASSSPRRQELIRALRLPVLIQASHADETVAVGLPPAEIVETLSLRKAHAVADEVGLELTSGIVIGSDTVVVLKGQVLGKPVDEADAFQMLQLLQGGVHQVYSGIACIDLANGVRKLGHRKTDVIMRALTPEQILRYIAAGESNDKAGAYAIQGLGATLIESINGCYFNVVGLPLSLLSEMLCELNIDVL